jgi:hypothetical protein
MRLVLVSVIALAALAQPVVAQTARPLRPQVVDQNRATDALNREQLEKLKAGAAAARIEHQKAVIAYEKAVNDRAAAQALAISSYQRAVQDWRIAATACQAGDRARCAPASD